MVMAGRKSQDLFGADRMHIFTLRKKCLTNLSLLVQFSHLLNVVKVTIVFCKHIDFTKPKSLVACICEYYRRYGIFTLGKEISRRMFRRKDTHMRHFRSIEELTELLYMFKITRTKEAREGNQLYVECLKE